MQWALLCPGACTELLQQQQQQQQQGVVLQRALGEGCNGLFRAQRVYRAAAAAAAAAITSVTF
jgi:hypothetical protein